MSFLIPGDIKLFHLFSQTIITKLCKKSLTIFTKFNYWRTKSKQEIDFIIQKDNKLHAIEVKWSRGPTYNLRRFKEIYPNADSYTISMIQDFALDKRIIPAYLI